MFNNFSFGAWNMNNFEAEVWKFQHVEKFSKCQVIYLSIPPCLTFYVSFKWENCLHQSCISFKFLQHGHKFDVIWIWNDRVIYFWSLEKSLVQWYRSKVTYYVTSYHMLIKVELALTPNIKIEVDILNLIVQLGNISSHKNWASYGLGKLTFKLGFRQNDL